MDPNVARSTQCEDDEPLLTQPPEDWRRERAATTADQNLTMGTATDDMSCAESQLQTQNEDALSPPSFPMFQTAGKNVTISTTSLSWTNDSVPSFDQNTSNVHNNETSSAPINKDHANNSSEPDNLVECIPMFQTAGTKHTIHISKESLTKANNLFSGIEVETPDTQPQTHCNGIIGSSNNADVISSFDPADACDNSVQHHGALASNGMTKPSASFPMFQTAGTKQTIHVSKESMSKVNALFSGTEIESLESRSKLHSNQLDGAAIEACDIESSDNQQDLGDSKSNKPLQYVPVFQTAGKKQTIHVSKESLSKVNDLFLGTEVESLETQPEMLCNQLDTTSGKELSITDVFDDENNKSLISQRSDTAVMVSHNLNEVRDSFPVFQTAGKKQTIHVSRESLLKASDLFSDMNVEPSDTMRDQRQEASCDALCENDMHLDRANDVSELVPNNEKAESSDHPPSAMFQTAGKRVTIGVSAESLRKIDALFTETEADMANCQQRTHKRPSKDCEHSACYDPSSTPILSNVQKSAETVEQEVANPYINKKSASYTPPKRTMEQVGRPSINPKSLSTSKQVYNPYAKQKTDVSPVRNACQVTRTDVLQANDDNPYADKKPVPMNLSSEVPIEAIVEDNQIEGAESSMFTVSAASSTNILHSVAPSRFFSMADRLPSRNVSYQPAEILTVGDLYRYLYQKSCDYDNTKENNQELGERETSKPTYRQLTSVRITGVLLFNSFSDSHEVKTDLYAGGAWLMVGDPLEKTRCATPKPYNTPSTRKASSKTASCNIDQAAGPKDDTLISTGSAIPKSVSTSDTPEVVKPTPLTTPLHDNTSSGTKNNTLHTTARSDGLINDKKRKLVCNKYSGRNSLSSSRSMLNARKFQTPKRIDSTSTLPTNSVNANRCASFSSSNGLASRTHASANGRILGANSIIQRHPSPVVPVWNGSRSDTYGLDGSVTGDLVMVMGEIVVELCDSCKDLSPKCAKAEDAPKPDEEPEGNNPIASESSDQAPIQNVRDAARLISSFASKARDPNSTKCCSECVRFLRARFVKNANGTDMNLQKEALQVRREYMKKRQEEMALLFAEDLEHFTIGSGLFA
jgi:hypothetical protein